MANLQQEYLDALRENTEARRRAEVEAKRLADETSRLADEQAKTRRAEETRLLMLTEIAAGAVQSGEITREIRQQLAELRDYVKLQFEGFKEQQAETRFHVESLRTRVAIIAGKLIKSPEAIKEFDRLDQREAIQFQLDQYQRNLNDLEQQKAMQGTFPDVSLIRQIEYTKLQIEDLKNKLAGEAD